MRELNKALQQNGYRSGEIHGDMEQSQRIAELDRFKAGEVNILVASDVAARGLDIKGVSHVFNFDAPWHPDDYVHRIGRTGRAGATGIAYTLVAPDDAENIANIEKLTGHREADRPGHPASRCDGGSNPGGGSRGGGRAARAQCPRAAVVATSRAASAPRPTARREEQPAARADEPREERAPAPLRAPAPAAPARATEPRRNSRVATNGHAGTTATPRPMVPTTGGTARCRTS